MSALVSISNLDAGIKCIARNVVAQVHAEEAEVEIARARGNSVHDFLRGAVADGVEKALDALREAGEPEEFIDLCAAIEVDALPWASFDKLYVEAGFILNVFTGEARFMGEHCTHDSLRGQVGDDEIGGVVDLVGVDRTESVAYLYDYKTGRIWHDPTTSWQLLGYAVCVAEHFKVDNVHAEFLHIREGQVYRRAVDFDLGHLDAARAEMQQQALRVRTARRELAFGVPPPATMGPHCDYCPCLRYCPAVTAHLRALAASPTEVRVGPLLVQRNGKVEVDLSPLTPEEAGRGYLVLKEYRRVLDALDEAFDVYARHVAVPLGGRRVLTLAPGEAKERVVDGAKALPVLKELNLESAVEVVVKTSKDAIKKAAGGAKAAEPVFVRLREVGALAKVAPAPSVREIELPEDMT